MSPDWTIKPDLRGFSSEPADFKAGDSLQLKGRVYYFDSPKIQEDKFNRQNIEPNYGYYSVGQRDNYCQDWQIGWVGGMMSTYPLLIAGNEQSKANVIRNFDW